MPNFLQTAAPMMRRYVRKWDAYESRRSWRLNSPPELGCLRFLLIRTRRLVRTSATSAGLRNSARQLQVQLETWRISPRGTNEARWAAKQRRG